MSLQKIKYAKTRITQNSTNSLPLRENTHSCLSCWSQGHFPDPLRSSSSLLIALFGHSSLVGRFPLRFLSGLPPDPFDLFSYPKFSVRTYTTQLHDPSTLNANSSVGSMWPHFSKWKSTALNCRSKYADLDEFSDPS